MEYCGGGSVEGIMKGSTKYLFYSLNLLALRAPLTELEISSILRDCLLGLGFLHSKQKMHRDIKCGMCSFCFFFSILGNILVHEDGSIKLGKTIFVVHS